MPKALLFDLDGTLAKTRSQHLSAWAQVLRPFGIEVDGALYAERIDGRMGPEVVEALLPGISPERAWSVVEAKEADFRRRAEDLEPLPGLRDFVARARRRGWTLRRGSRLALVTNAPQENVYAVLEALNLKRSFERIVIVETATADRVSPTPYLVALDVVNVSPLEALAFDDSPYGVASAVGAGIPTVGIASSHSPEELRRAGARLVAEDFTDPALQELLNS